MEEKPERLGLFSLVCNLTFALIKMLGGFFGNSFALIADGIESLADSLSSIIVWNGLRVAERGPDAAHPYGHGKAESLAAFLAAIALLLSSLFIAWNAIQEILHPRGAPSVYVLPIIVLVLIGKEGIYRYLNAEGKRLGSDAVKLDALHHRLDALTTLGVLVGVLVAVIGGEGYAMADDVAALLIAGFIMVNAVRLSKPSVDALLDTDVEGRVKERIRQASEAVEGVEQVESMRLTKSGRHYILDIHLEVEGSLTVEEGHRIAHLLKDTLLEREDLKVSHVLTHVEPFNENAQRPPKA